MKPDKDHTLWLKLNEKRLKEKLFKVSRKKYGQAPQ